ncbi:MAG: DMT family transporter [Bacillota bacterium]|jgi:drug/metabolite transporter (DMT)-like permease
MKEDLLEARLEKVGHAKIIAYILLILTAFGWGLSTVLGKVLVGTITPAHILLVRAVIASFVIFLAAPGKIVTLNRADFRAGAILGFIIFTSYYLGIFSLKYTTASKAAFLMALNVLLVPASEAVLKKRLPSKWIVISVIFSLIGLQLISGINGDGFNFGDFLAFLCAVTYTVYTIALDRWGRDKDDFILSFVQLAILGICSFLVIVLFEEFDLSGVWISLLPLLAMGVFGTGMATLFQTKAQKTASTESVGIILLADPLFTLVLAALFLREPIFISGLVGGGLILLSCVIAIIKKI